MVRKYTKGTVLQIFDNQGNLISQSFEADYSCQYENEYSESLHPDDSRINFYAPYDMVQPKKENPMTTNEISETIETWISENTLEHDERGFRVLARDGNWYYEEPCYGRNENGSAKQIPSFGENF